MKKAIIGVTLLLVVSGGAAVWMFARPSQASPPPSTTVLEGAVVDVGSMTLNLGGGGGHVARLGLALVLVEGADVAAVEERLALVKDAAVSIVASSDAEGLRSVTGIDALRDQLTGEMVELFGADVVVRAVITELLVQ